MKQLKIAYLLSQYPAVNHVFMLREVLLLRRLGFDIQVASVRQPDREIGAMTAAEQAEAENTYFVKRAGVLHAALAHACTMVTRPVPYFRGLATAVRNGSDRRPQMLFSLFYFAEAVTVGHWMRGKGIAHLHAHFASTIACLVGRIFAVTVSNTIHGPAEFQNPQRFRLAEKINESLFCCGISQYGVSQMMHASTYEDWPKLELTALGVDLSEFAPRPFCQDPVHFEMICVGRLAPVKGQHLLIEAIATLVAEGRQVRLRLAGDGPDRASLLRDAEQRGLAEQVVFEGNVNQDRLKELYRRADAMVLSSFAEGLPVVLMEAMAMEIPCVAPWVNGIPEIISNEVDGLLVPPGDAKALAQAIGQLMDDTELRRRLGQNGRTKVQARFDLHKNTEHLADVFKRRLNP